MKNPTHIHISRSSIMRDVEEMAAYYAAKSGDIDKTYLNGLLVEPDKGHLDIYFREAMADLANMSEDYPHNISDGAFTLSLPMNFDEETAPELSEAIRQYFVTVILRAYMSYIGTKGETFSFKDSDEKKAALNIKIRALLNHRRRLSRAFFEGDFEGYRGCCIVVQ